MVLDVEKELAELEKQEAEAIKAAEEAKQRREAIIQAKKELEKKKKEELRIEALSEVFHNPANLIKGIENENEFLLDATREYFGVASDVSSELVFSVLKTRLENIKEEPKRTKDDLHGILKEEEIKVYGENPLESLDGFKFRLANQKGQVWGRPRQATCSPAFGYTIRDSKVITMDTSDRRNETHEFFNRWTLWDVMFGECVFDAFDRETQEPFKDTLTTLNPNVIQLETKDGKVVLIAPYRQSRISLEILGDDAEGTAPHMTVVQYFSSILICMRHYFGTLFELNFARAFKKYGNAYVSGSDGDNPCLIYKAFEEANINTKTAYIAKAGVGRGIYPSNKLKNLKKTAVHAYIRYALEALVSQKDIEQFCKSVKFYGVFDDVAQGDYEMCKTNYYHTF